MAERLNLTADEVLTTTRAVRRRLDLERPVGRDVIEECLEIALQAPTGSNRQDWQFVFIDDDDTKLKLSQIYARNFADYAAKQSASWDPDDPRAAQQPAIGKSAVYLTENFHKVPVLLIPCLNRRLDGASAAESASAWGSLLPAVWSFMLALRERGLGSAWTTIHLRNGGDREAAELLGIPYPDYAQAGLFPIAYTIGTDFQLAKRLGVETVMHWNQW